MLPDLAVLRIAAYEDSGKLIGHHVLPVKGMRPGFRHVGLKNEIGQRLLLPMIFVHIAVKDYVPDRFTDLAEALADPIKYQTEREKRDIQLRVLTDEDEMRETQGDGGGTSALLGAVVSAGNGPGIVTEAFLSMALFCLSGYMGSIFLSNSNTISDTLFVRRQMTYRVRTHILTEIARAVKLKPDKLKKYN